MNILAVSLVLISALFHSLRNIFTKQSVDKQLFLWWYTVWGLIYFLPVFIYFMWQSGIPNLSVIGLCFFSGFLHFIYWVFLTKAYEFGDISLTYPIMRSSPALVFLIAVLFLNEKVSAGGVVGIIVVMCGIYFLSFGQIKFSKIQFLKLEDFFKDRSIQYALIGLVSITGYSIADKMIVEYINPILFVFLHMLFGFMCYSIYIYFRNPLSRKSSSYKLSIYVQCCLRSIERRITHDVCWYPEKYLLMAIFCALFYLSRKLFIYFHIQFLFDLFSIFLDSLNILQIDH